MAVRLDNSTPNRKINYKVTVGNFVQSTTTYCLVLTCRMIFFIHFCMLCFVEEYNDPAHFVNRLPAPEQMIA